MPNNVKYNMEHNLGKSKQCDAFCDAAIDAAGTNKVWHRMESTNSVMGGFLSA